MNQSCSLPSNLADRESIRHLLIGPPEAVQLTLHRLHNLRYAEAGLWSPAIALSGEQLILTLDPGEVMRVLVKVVRFSDRDAPRTQS